MGRPRKQSLLVGLAAAALAAGVCAGCAGGRQSKRDVYWHLMTDAQREEFREMERRREPASLKLAYLQRINVYQTWAEQPKDIQEAILRREVGPGMTPDQVRMAIGRPDRIEDVTTVADRNADRKRVLWHYGEGGWRLGVGGRDRRTVCFVGEKVAWVRPPSKRQAES